MKKRLVVVLAIGVLVLVSLLQVWDKETVLESNDSEEVLVEVDEVSDINGTLPVVEGIVFDNFGGSYEKVPLIKVDYGVNDSLIVRVNSEVVFDSKEVGSSKDVLLDEVALTSRNNILEIEYVNAEDGVKVSFRVFAEVDSEESLLAWGSVEDSGKARFPLDFE